jgi:hypothetical protein
MNIGNSWTSWTFKEDPPSRSREDTRSCIIVVFRVKHFDFIEIFGHVMNSNTLTRIFEHSTVHLDLKDLLELNFLKIQKKIPRRYKIVYNYCFCAKHFEKFEIFGHVMNSNTFTRIFGHSTVRLELKDLLELNFLENSKKDPEKIQDRV